LISLVALLALQVGVDLPAFAQEVHHFDLTASDAADPAVAIHDFGQQSGIQILVAADALKGKQLNAVAGDLTADDAFHRLLAGTGLAPRYVHDRAVAIVADNRQSFDAALIGDEQKPDQRLAAQTVGEPEAQGASGATASGAAARAQQPDTPAPSPGEPTTSRTTLEEVIVTAQKREERLQDVPVPVTAINAGDLVDSNQLRVQDYYASVPGLNVMPEASSSFQQLSIRGIVTGLYTNPTVGITVDDVPYGSSTFLGGGGGTVMPDIDPADLARIEVLRGPQGTLYGASSMGGLLKFVTVDPSTEGISGRAQADLNGVHNGNEPGYGVRGSVNIPLGEGLAVRASGFTRQDPGYIDNVETGRQGVNESRYSGGRLSALWRLSDAFVLKLSALIQDGRGDGMSDVDVLPGLGDLQQSALRGTGPYDKRIQAYSANLSAKLGAVDLTAVTGYNINAFSDSYDLTYFAGPYTEDQWGVSGTPLSESDRTTKLTQEIRLSSSIGTRLDWLLGGFYSREHSDYQFSYLAADPTTGRVVGTSLHSNWRVAFSEYAGFADLTYHFTDRLDVQLGARQSHIMETYDETDSGPFVPLFYGVDSPLIRPTADTSANAFTYLATPRFKVSPDLMVYARLASGYRAGGPNAVYAGPGAPPKYDPDKTQNYEVGVKGDFLSHTLSVDGSFYYIDWKDIQISLINPDTGITYNSNGSQAKSQGVEFSLQSRPLTGLTMNAWVAWNDAVLTKPFPSTAATHADSGDRLPYSSRFSGNLSIEQAFPLGGRLSGFTAGAASFVGNRLGEFTGSERQELPGYTRIDLRAGARSDSWTASVFVNNVADRRGVLNGGLGQFPPFGFILVQPRTVGLSVSNTF